MIATATRCRASSASPHLGRNRWRSNPDQGAVTFSALKGWFNHGVRITPNFKMEEAMLKGGLLWMMGVPVIVVIILLVMGVI